MYDLTIEVVSHLKTNWWMYCIIIFLLFVLVKGWIKSLKDDQEFKGSESEAIHNLLLKSIPGICRDAFDLDDTTKNKAGEWVSVHGVPGKKKFSITVEYKTVNGRIRILWVEAGDDEKLSKLIQCNWSAGNVRRK